MDDNEPMDVLALFNTVFWDLTKLFWKVIFIVFAAFSGLGLYLWLGHFVMEVICRPIN